MPPAINFTPLEEMLRFIAKPTPQLRAAIERFGATLAPPDFAEMLACVRSAFGKYTAKLLEFRPGVERGRAFHELMDRELKAVGSLPVSCRDGCSGCCHYEVEVTQDEAEILRTLVQAGFPIDRLRLEEQASRTRKSGKWSHLGNPANRCVFLGQTGSCQIYQDRPAICRKHLVVTPASACTETGAAVEPVQALMAEILLSAATSLEAGTCASLPKMLQAALQADERWKPHRVRTRRAFVRAYPDGLVNPARTAVFPFSNQS